MKQDRVQRSIRDRRTARVRARIFGTPSRPRLSVFRSNKYLAVQLIDDEAGRTLFAASTREMKEKTPKALGAAKLGMSVAENLKKLGVAALVFDRGPYAYHGRVRTIAEAIRKGGIRF